MDVLKAFKVRWTGEFTPEGAEFMRDFPALGEAGGEELWVKIRKEIAMEAHPEKGVPGRNPSPKVCVSKRAYVRKAEARAANARATSQGYAGKEPYTCLVCGLLHNG